MADKKEILWEVATILSMINLSENFHVLPVAGGLLDQDSMFIHYYMYVNQLREMRRQLDEHKSKNRQPSGAQGQWRAHANYG